MNMYMVWLGGDSGGDGTDAVCSCIVVIRNLSIVNI